MGPTTWLARYLKSLLKIYFFITVPPEGKKCKNVGNWLHLRLALRLYCQWISSALQEAKFKYHSSKFDADLVVQTLHVLRERSVLSPKYNIQLDLWWYVSNFVVSGLDD